MYSRITAKKMAESERPPVERNTLWFTGYERLVTMLRPLASEISPLWMKLSPFAKNGCCFSMMSGRLELAKRRCQMAPRDGSSASASNVLS